MNILLIDDNEAYCKSLRSSLKLHGINCSYLTEGSRALSTLEEGCFDAALIDIMLGEQSGIEYLKEIKTALPSIPVIMITGYGTIETAVESIRYGAFEYIQKPVRFEKLLRLLETVKQLKQLNTEKESLKERIIRTEVPIVTANRELLELMEKARKLSQSNLPVLITGENGTGKELFAQYLHLNSPRGHQEMVTINCAALTEGLLDNELFGHEKGSYTGAHKEHIGVFEKADKNSLFLDEIGDMALTTQAKILRVLQNHEIRRVGGNKVIKINVNVIAATNKSIEKMIEEGTFREDLYYRLKAAQLKIPPLRNRPEDIMLLAMHFLQSFAEDSGKPVTGFTDEVGDLFLDYSWPGNVRELKNCVQYACTMTAGSRIEVKDLPADLHNTGREKHVSVNYLQESEKEILLKTLQRFHYNKSKCASHLNISRSTLYNKLLRYGIEH